MVFDELYFPYDSEKNVFGNKWCGPKKYSHGQDILIAEYPKASEDGQPVNVYCNAMPARFYTLKVKESNNSIGEPRASFEVSTGSSQVELAASIAEAISEGMLGFVPTIP